MIGTNNGFHLPNVYNPFKTHSYQTVSTNIALDVCWSIIVGYLYDFKLVLSSQIGVVDVLGDVIQNHTCYYYSACTIWRDSKPLPQAREFHFELPISLLNDNSGMAMGAFVHIK